jgi:hypothetical protein
MNYSLNETNGVKKKVSTWPALKSLLQLIAHEKKNLILGLHNHPPERCDQPYRSVDNRLHH